MFGLEQKKEGVLFDLEAKLRGTEAAKIIAELKQLTSSRTEELKALLRQGGDKEAFDRVEILLHGYTALEQVIGKISKK